jgi:hypothetical protein
MQLTKCTPSQQEHFLDFRALAYRFVVSRMEFELGGLVLAVEKELVEKACSVGGTTRALRMKLGRKKWLVRVHDSFVTPIVGIREQRFPTCKRQH